MVIGAAPIVSLLTKSVHATGLKIGGSVLEKSVRTTSATWLPGLNFLCVVRFSILNSPSGCPPFWDDGPILISPSWAPLRQVNARLRRLQLESS